MTDRRFIRHQHIDSKGARIRVQCRFCSRTQQYNRHTFVAPCCCIGEARYVHRQCLQNWFITTFQNAFNQENDGDPLEFNVHCQVCKQRIEIEFSLVNKCSNYDQFVENLSEYKMWFVFLVIAAVAIVCVLIFLIIFASTGEGKNKSILAILIVVCCVLLLVVLIGFCWKFVMIKSVEIDKVPNNKDPPKIMGNEGDIDDIDDENYQDPYFGERKDEEYRRDSYADRSLMLESKRNSGSERGSVASKTLTDLVMKKMYRHDGNEGTERRSNLRTRKEFMMSEEQRRSRKENNMPKMVDEGMQVSIQDVSRRKSRASKSREKKDKSVGRTIHEKDVSQPRSRSRSRRTYDQEYLDKHFVKYPDKDVTPGTRPTPHYHEEQQEEDYYQPSSEGNRQLNIQKPSEEQQDDRQYIEPSRTIENVSSQPPKSDKLKLKSKKDPIKIKLKV